MNPTTADRPPLIVITGARHSDKTLVASRLADALGIGYIDSLRLLPPAARQKLAAHLTLTAGEQLSWSLRVGRSLQTMSAQGAVTAFRAPHRGDRDPLRREAPGVFFIHLDSHEDLAAPRLPWEPSADFWSDAESTAASPDPLEPDEYGMRIHSVSQVHHIIAAAMLHPAVMHAGFRREVLTPFGAPR